MKRLSPILLAGTLALALAGCAGIELPASSPGSRASGPAVAQQWQPHPPRAGRSQPLVAVIGRNDGTELFDFLVPYGILARSGVARVVALAPEDRPMRLRPDVRLQPQASFAQFDRAEPAGADYVVVPAVVPEATRDPALLDWLRQQAAKGATVIGICDGALVLGHAGLLEGHRATGHWATQSLREKDFPGTRWLTNVRYVADREVVTSAGVSAAVPTALALVEAIAGHPRAADLAASLGTDGWGVAHDSERFHMTAGLYVTAGLNWLSPRDELDLRVADGIDELQLAQAADALGRTFRSRPHVVSANAAPVRTRDGLVLLPDAAGDPIAPGPHRREVALPGGPPLRTLDAVLADVARWYGPSTAAFVALQMEYPGAARGDVDRLPAH